MGAGELDRRVTLKSPDKLDYNEWNEPIYTPGQTYSVQAKYEPVSDAEKVAAAQVMASLTARFTVRWAGALEDMNAQWSLTFEGRDFDCSGVKEVGRREYLEITASARSDLSPATSEAGE